MHIFTVNISQTVTDRTNIANAKAGFQLEYLHLTVIYAKGQDQGHKYLGLQLSGKW